MPYSSTHYTSTVALTSPGAKCPRLPSHRARTYPFHYTPLLFECDTPSQHTQGILTFRIPSRCRQRTPGAYASDESYRGDLRVRAAKPINFIPCRSTRRGMSQTDARESAADVPAVTGGVPRRARTGDDYHGRSRALSRRPFSGACKTARATHSFKLRRSPLGLLSYALRSRRECSYRTIRPSWSLPSGPFPHSSR